MFSRMRAALTRDAIKSTSARPPCPPDAAELGRAGWTLLHTMAAFYPIRPTTTQQSAMSSFIGAVSLFYPCEHCAQHLTVIYHANIPLASAVASRDALSTYWCEYHNAVNAQTGKARFDCGQLLRALRRTRLDRRRHV